MTTCRSTTSQSTARQFGDERARSDLAAYTKNGPAATTRRLLAGLVAAGPLSGTVLDIGSGIGVLSPEQSAGHSRRVLALSYPPDRWYARLAVWIENLMRKLSGNSFRAFVHPAAAMEALIRAQGFARASRAVSLLWCVDVYRRSPNAVAGTEAAAADDSSG